MDKTIKCRICEKVVGRQGLSLHLKTHEISFKDYLEKYFEDFPDFQKCETCGKTCKRNKRFCSRECTTEWRKTLVGEKGIRYGSTMSEKTKEKISKSQIERLSDKNNHWATGTHLSDETKQKISETRIELGHGVGEKNGMYGKTHTVEALKKIFKHRKMNKLEKVVAEYLDENNVDYTFQFFITEDGICKSYDFKFNNYILEVHGDYWHGGKGVKKHVHNVSEVIENDKLKKKMAEERGYKVIYVWEHEIEKLDYLISPYLYK